MADNFDINQPGATLLPPSLGGPASTGQIVQSVAPKLGPRADAQPPQQQPQPQQPMSIEEIQRARLQKRLELEDQYAKALQLDQMNRQKAQQMAIASGYARDAQNRAMVNAPLPPTYTPERKQMPTNAPRFSPRDPGIAIAQPLSLIAAIGGLFARRAGTATIRAMTGAMEGLRESDWQKYEASMKEFDENLKLAVEYNRAEHEKYQEAWDNRKNTWAERMAKMQALATSYGNTALQNALSTGNAELIGAQLKAMEGGDKAIDNFIKATRGGGAGHAMDAEKAAAVKERTKELVAKGMSEGQAHTQAIREQSPSQNLDERLALEREKQAGREHLADKKADSRMAELERKSDLTAQEHRELAELKEKLAEQLETKKHSDRMEEITKRLEARAPGIGGMLNSMNKVNAADFNMRLQKLKKEHPEMSEEDQVIQALNEHNQHKSGDSFHKLPLSVQGEIQKGWGDTPAAQAWIDGTYTLDQANKRALAKAAATLRFGEDVATFAKNHPRAFGAFAAMMNTTRIESLLKTRIQQYAGIQDPEQWHRAVSGEIDNLFREAGARLPTGEAVQFSDANDALTLLKMMTQLALSDAASLSTNGQGGTVYLDRVFRNEVFNVNMTPQAALRLIAIRQDDARKFWMSQNPNNPLDWRNRKDLDETPFFRDSRPDARGDLQPSPYYLEGISFNQYSNLHGQQLQNAIAKDPGLSIPVRAALLARDQFQSREQVDQWLNAQPPDKKPIAEQIARILKQQYFGDR